MSPIAQDIIFSVRLQSFNETWQLQRITLSIPLGDPSTEGGVPGPLTALPYTGPGASMLSNLRFNPLVSYSTDQSSLLITLSPRSMKGWVWIKECPELSFMLGAVNANVSDPSVGPVSVVPTVTEYYVKKDPKGFTPLQAQTEGILMVLQLDN
jgi:hypothetical protein